MPNQPHKLPTMPVLNAVRLNVALAIIGLSTVSCGFSGLWTDIFQARQRMPASYFSQYEQRFGEVAGYLPKGQIVSYGDNTKNYCEAFVLAQYAVAPAMIATHRLDCGHTNENAPTTAKNTNLILENSLDPKSDAFLSRLFPGAQLEPTVSTNAAGAGGSFSGRQLVLVKDFSHGVRLYSGSQR